METTILKHIAIYSKNDHDSVKYGRSAGLCVVRCENGWQFVAFGVDVIGGILQQACRVSYSETLYVISPVVLLIYGCETWFVTLKQEVGCACSRKRCRGRYFGQRGRNKERKKIFA
jgi:hypothetical protein